MPYTQSEIESLMQRFEACCLPKVEWTHEAHLIVAVYYSLRYDAMTAMNNARVNITNHNASVGTPNTDTEGYHETITQFWMLTVRDFLKDDLALNDEQAFKKLIASPVSLSTYPLEYYSPGLLFSTEARRQWKEPDRKKLPALPSVSPSSVHP